MVDLFDDSTKPGGGGWKVPCSEEGLVPEPTCLVGSLMGVIGGWLVSQPFITIIPISDTENFLSFPISCSVDLLCPTQGSENGLR